MPSGHTAGNPNRFNIFMRTSVRTYGQVSDVGHSQGALYILKLYYIDRRFDPLGRQRNRMGVALLFDIVRYPASDLVGSVSIFR